MQTLEPADNFMAVVCNSTNKLDFFQDCSVEGFHVPKGHAIIYLTRHAQRDPKIFDDPDEFKPERWENKYAFQNPP